MKRRVYNRTAFYSRIERNKVKMKRKHRTRRWREERKTRRNGNSFEKRLLPDVMRKGASASRYKHTAQDPT